MKISLGTHGFSSIDGLTRYLVTTYEKDKAITAEVNLQLASQELNASHIEQLATFLQNASRPRAYKIELTTPGNEANQIILDNAYLARQRERFSAQAQTVVADLLGDKNSSVPIRKAKKHWIDETAGSAINIQFASPGSLSTPAKRMPKAAGTAADEPEVVVTPPAVTRIFDGSAQQFASFNKSPNKARYADEFACLIARVPQNKKRNAALMFFIKELETDARKTALIQNYLSTLPLADYHYKGLGKVLIHSGNDGLLLLLQQFDELHKRMLFRSFSELFLAKAENYLALVTPASLAQLEQLSQFTVEQREWWNFLVTQHQKAGTPADFNDLFFAYQNFLTELAKISPALKLPTPCPVVKTTDMKVTLARVLLLIKNAPNPQEQMAYLDGLDFSAKGALSASQNDGYKFVAKQMELTPNVGDDNPDYSMPKLAALILGLFTKPTYEESAIQFYRFIGTQDWAFNFAAYQQIEREIQTKNYPLELKQQLLMTVALMATGERACANAGNPYEGFTQLLKKLEAVAQVIDATPNSHKGLQLVVLACAQTLSFCQWEYMPTLSEMEHAWDILLLSNQLAGGEPTVLSDNIVSFMVNTINLLSVYDTAGTTVLLNYKRRLILEHAKNKSTQKLDAIQLLTHFVMGSKLDSAIPALFINDTESLKQFISLMSLVSDAVLPVTNNKEADSAFEAQVKKLATAMHKLTPEHRALLLTTLNRIPVAATTNLPSLEQLIKITQGINPQIMRAFKHVPDNQLLPLLLKMQAGLSVHAFYEKEIAALFDFSPYPDLPQFVQLLHQGSSKKLLEFIESFDADPMGARAAQVNSFDLTTKTSGQILAEQFSGEKIGRLVENIQDIEQDTSLTADEQFDLAQQVSYVNAIGHAYPLVIKNQSTNPETIDKYDDLTKLKRHELGKIFTHLQIVLRNPGISPAEKIKAELNLLAVMREQYCRATGCLVDTTQLGIILMSLRKQPQNVLMELAAEERSGAAVALLAAMQWVLADGGAVDVCVEDLGAATNNYAAAQEFFRSLGIASSHIKIDSPPQTYQVAGINYATVVDLAVYQQRAKINGEPVTTEKAGYPVAKHLILSQVSLASLDERMVFNQATESLSAVNPYAWVYPLVNAFVEGEQFKETTAKTAWRDKQDIDELKASLAKNASKTQLQQLGSLEYSQLDGWINAAIAAQRLVEGSDFQIREVNGNARVAVPSIMGVEQPGAVFGKGEQQCLHALLQKRYADKGWTFAVNAEVADTNSVSLRDFINEYKAHGRIIGLAESLGRDEKLSEQCRKLNVNAVYSIPSHTEKPRKTNTITAAKKNQQELAREVKILIDRAQNGQPIVLVAQDAEEAQYLKNKLQQDYGTRFKIDAFVALNDEPSRTLWMKKQAGQNDTITIVTPALVEKSTFYTKHKEGFFAVQTYLESKDKIINQVLGNSKLGQYSVLYEDHQQAFSLSWSLKSKNERPEVAEKIVALQKNLRDVAAVERYYQQMVFGVQHVVMKQFDEWQAFLQIIHSSNELPTLNQELLLQRDQLLCMLNEQWLNGLDPERQYANPYVRRDDEGQLLTTHLEEVFNQFETKVVALWEQQRAALREKAKPKIKEGTVDEMHCDYLTKVSLVEELKQSKLEDRKQKKEREREKKSTHRRILTGLDVDGAMLRYADGELEQYRVAYEKTQVELLKQDIAKILENDTSLKRSARRDLLKKAQNLGNLNSLIFFLNQYASVSMSESNFYKKYAFQATAQEVLRIHRYLGFAETSEARILRENYFENVAAELIDELENTLAWSVKGKRGLGYVLERREVVTAAEDLLYVVAELKNATNAESQQLAMKKLYKVLVEHETKLEGLWIFSFGHKNTRTLIKKTRTTLDSLVTIGYGAHAMKAEFMRDCKEEAVYEVMRARFNAAAAKVEKKQEKILKDNQEWRKIMAQLNAIQKGSTSLHTLNELNEFLSKKIDELRKTNAELVAPLTQLRGEVRKLWDECGQKHADLLDKSNYLAQKAGLIEAKLKALPGFHLRKVTLKAGHNGANDYFDLVVEGQGPASALIDFVQYNSSGRAELIDQRGNVTGPLAKKETLLQQLTKLKNEQMPLLTYDASGKVDVNLFPDAVRQQAMQLLKLKEYDRGACPSDFTGFSAQAQADFHDRAILNKWDSSKLSDMKEEELLKLKDPSIRADALELYKKINPPKVEEPKEKPGYFWGALQAMASAVTNFLVYKESEEDFRYQLYWLKSRVDSRLKDVLHPQIDEKHKELMVQIDTLSAQESSQKGELQDKANFLAREIAKEDKKGGIYCKRFKDMDEFNAFETQFLTAYAPRPESKAKPKAAPQQKPAQKEKQPTFGLQM